MHHYDYKKTDNRAGNAFRPHEASGDYELPNHILRAEWFYTLTDRSVLNASVGRSFWNSRADPYTDNPPAFDNVTQRWTGAYVNSVGSDSHASRQPEQPLAVRRQLQLLPAGIGGGTHEFKAGGYFTRDVYNKFQEARGEGTAASAMTTCSTLPTMCRSKCCSTTRRLSARTRSTTRAATSATTGASAID